MITTEEITSNQLKLKKYALSLTKNTEEAEDLTQDTLMRAWRYREKFRGGYPYAWLSKMMYRLFINRLRRSALEKKCKVELGTSNSRRPTFPSFDQYIDLKRAIRKLPDPFWSLFLLSKQGYTQQEISQKLAIKKGTVKSRTFRAKRFLHKECTK